MTIANVLQGRTAGLPPALRTAQDAIRLPEVQEMLRRLSEYKLGIFMPHLHDEQTGGFQSLPDDVMQVESGLQVSFQAAQEITSQAERFLPVGWCWRAGAPATSAVCEMVEEQVPGTARRYTKHKMSNT